MILLENGAAATGMQLCRSCCELCSISRLGALLLAACCGLITLSHRLSLIALPKPWDDFYMAKSSVRWVRVVVFEVRLRFRDRSNMFAGWHNVNIFRISFSSFEQLYVPIRFL